MKTITFPIYIYAEPLEYDWDTGPNKQDGIEFRARDWKMGKENEGSRFLGEQEITVEIPDGLNPTAMEIESLEAQRNELLAETQVKVNHINDRISKLQALTYDEVAA